MLALDLTTVEPPHRHGLRIERTVGTAGTRLSAFDSTERVGYIEVDLVGGIEQRPHAPGWADIGNLWVEPDRRREGIGRRLLGDAAQWLRLGHVDRLLDYADAEDAPYLGFLRCVGFVDLTITERVWELPTLDTIRPEAEGLSEF